MHNYTLLPIQLWDLQRHPTIRLLMRAAQTEEARESAKATAEGFIEKHLLSGQAIQFCRTYALTNIRMDEIFVSQ